VDKTQLCIAAGKLSWVLHLTVVVLNEDGNLYEIP
jgi:exosome complex RNA-binding protein Rrp42 (RNase PH superfamily)